MEGPFRHPRRGFELSDVLVPWDIENLPVPGGFPADLVVERVFAHVRTLGYLGSVEMFAVAANRYRVPGFVQLELQNTWARYWHLREDSKNAADREIQYHIRRWAMRRRSGTVLMLTGDGGFAPVIRDLRRRGFNVLLCYRENSINAVLIPIVYHGWTWRAILGLGPVQYQALEARLAHSLWLRVANLLAYVDDVVLYDMFSVYPSLQSAEIAQNPVWRPRMFVGYVQFGNHYERLLAFAQFEGLRLNSWGRLRLTVVTASAR